MTHLLQSHPLFRPYPLLTPLKPKNVLLPTACLLFRTKISAAMNHVSLRSYRVLPSALTFIKRSLAFPFPHRSDRKLSVRPFLQKLRHISLEISKAESCAVSGSWMLRFHSCCKLSVRGCAGTTRGYINDSNSIR